MNIKKFLIFRTDRIGDFLLSAILIESIKRNEPNSHITVIGSKKNFLYIKSFSNVDDVFLLEDSIIGRIKLVHKLKKNEYDNIIIHDNKKRSKFISMFLKSKNKIQFFNYEFPNHISMVKKILEKLDYDYSNSDLNIFLNRKNFISFNIKNYCVFHFDEKWFNHLYIKHYINIEPQIDEMIFFLKSLIKKIDSYIIVTTGLHNHKFFIKIMKSINDPKILFFKDLDFFELESIVSNSNMLISCHGFVSHVAAGNNIKQIDIIDDSYNYHKWTHHFRNYNFLKRKKFCKLSQEIIKII